MTNSLFTIYPYKHMDGWVFDDAAVGLVKEPFVAGADDLLTLLSKGLDKITVVFAAIPFPDAQLRIDKLTEEELKELNLNAGPFLVNYGTYYQQKERAHLLWLCPALNLYIKESPETIYIKVIKP